MRPRYDEAADAVAGFHRHDARSDGAHDARELETGNDAGRTRAVAPFAFEHVGAVESRVGNGDERIVAAGLGIGKVAHREDLEAARPVVERCAHQFASRESGALGGNAY